MRDLLEEKERIRLDKFASLLFAAVKEGIPVQRANPPITGLTCRISPDRNRRGRGQEHRLWLSLLMMTAGFPNLTAMMERIRSAFDGPVETINLRALDLRGGCLGCCQCGYNNTCVYTDGYVDFYTKRLAPADIIVIGQGGSTDRYLSSVWKQFFDGTFFKGHVPGLPKKRSVL